MAANNNSRIHDVIPALTTAPQWSKWGLNHPLTLTLAGLANPNLLTLTLAGLANPNLLTLTSSHLGARSSCFGRRVVCVCVCVCGSLCGARFGVAAPLDSWRILSRSTLCRAFISLFSLTFFFSSRAVCACDCGWLYCVCVALADLPTHTGRFSAVAEQSGGCSGLSARSLALSLADPSGVCVCVWPGQRARTECSRQLLFFLLRVEGERGEGEKGVGSHNILAKKKRRPQILVHGWF